MSETQAYDKDKKSDGGGGTEGQLDASVTLSLMNFADSTTAHGFSRLAASSGRTGSGLWMLFLVAAYTGLCYHTATLVMKHKSHPVSTSFIAEVPFQYPDIYLCSANPVGYSRITKSIPNTADYAYLYDTNLTAYSARLRQDVMNNSAAQVSLGIHAGWLNWQSKIMSTKVNVSPGLLNSCRISLQGQEFTGNFTSALTFSKSLEAVWEPCLSWSEARSRMRNISAAIADLVPNLGHAVCLHNSSLNISLIKALLGVSGIDNSFTIGSVLQGPFCFHRSANSTSGLNINYCGVPFCSKDNNGLANCSALSSNTSVNTAYMGSVQTSRSGKPCQAWESLTNGSLSSRFRNLSPTFQFRVFLPDSESVASVGSSCRSAAVMFKDPDSGVGWQPISRLIIDGQVGQGSWCLVEKQGYQNLTMESCTVPDCSTSLKCISGLLHQKYGPQVLSKLVGLSLDISLLDCSFGSRKCTPSDFTALHHPYYGACYRFNSEPFIRGLTPTQRGLRPLSLKLFADDHDFLGNRRPDTFTAVRAVMGGPYNIGESSEPVGFNLFVMPQGSFPSTYHAIPIYTGARSIVRMRFTQETDSTSRGLCNPIESTIDYCIHSWDPTVLRPRNEQNFASPDSYFFQFNSSSSAFISNQESCAYLAVVDEFIRDCNCLPYSLPIPTKYSNIIDCFYLNSSDPSGVDQLQEREACAVRLFAQMETLTEKFWAGCRANCKTPKYLIQLTTQPWPDASNAAYSATLQSLTSLIGFPKQVSPDQGLAMLYYSYLQGDQLVQPSSIERFGQSLAMRDAARSNLAWIQIQAEYPIGSGSSQTDGYPVENLLAEMGGILGLYCGVSVLTICELMDLMGRLLHRAALRSLRGSRVDSIRVSSSNLKVASPAS